MNGKCRKAAVNFDVLWYWAHCDNILLARAVKHLPTGCWTSGCYIPTHHDSHTSTPGCMQGCVNCSGCMWRDRDTLRGRGCRCRGGSACERVCLMGKLIVCYKVQPSKREREKKMLWKSEVLLSEWRFGWCSTHIGCFSWDKVRRYLVYLPWPKTTWVVLPQELWLLVGSGYLSMLSLMHRCLKSPSGTGLQFSLLIKN